MIEVIGCSADFECHGCEEYNNCIDCSYVITKITDENDGTTKEDA